MTTVATIAAELVLNAKDYIAGVKGASDATEKFWRGADGRLRDVQGRFVGAGDAAQNFSTRLGHLGDQMTRIGGVMTIGITLPLIAFGKAAFNASSAYEEALNKTNVVFEKNGDVIKEWSDKAAENMGMSSRAALEAVGTYGNLMQAMGMTEDESAKMSMSLVQLSSDLASFNDAKPEEVLLALRSGLSGEAEPLKRFGVALTEPIMKMKAFEMGLGDNVQALTEAQKIQVRYAIIMEQTTKAQGDFTNTMDSASNTAKRLSATWEDTIRIFGDELKPIIKEVMWTLIDLMRAYQALPGGVQSAIVHFAIFAAAMGPVINVLGVLSKSILFFSAGGGGATAVTWITGTLIPALGTFATWLTTTLVPALGSVGTFFTATLIPAIIPLLPILALIAAAVFLVWLVWKNWNSLVVTLSQLWQIMKLGLLTSFKLVAKAASNAWSAIKADASEMWEALKAKAQSVIDAVKQRITDFVSKVKTLWANIGNSFKQVFTNIVNVARNVFSGIASAIQKVVSYVKSLASAFMNLKLPAALTPGSPTPFEIGLRGIGSAMDALNKKSLPEMNAGLNAAPAGIAGAGGGRTTYVDNRRFAGGMSRDELQTALDSRMSALAGGI